MKVVHLYTSLLSVVAAWCEWRQMCREHQEVHEGVADDILFDAKARGEGAENRPNLSSDWFILLLHCKGYEQFVCTK